MSALSFNTWTNLDGSENYKCRAWVNFNGTGVVAIRAAGNVSSITDNGVGDYTVNFTTPMVDANYTVVASSNGPATGTAHVCAFVSNSNVRALMSTTQVAVAYMVTTNSADRADPSLCQVAVFR